MRLVFMMVVAGSLQASVLDSNFGFTVGHEDTASESQLYIEDAGGNRVTYHFEFLVKNWGTPIINRYGQLVGGVDRDDQPYTTPQPFIFYALFPYRFDPLDSDRYFHDEEDGFIGKDPAKYPWLRFSKLGYLPRPIPKDIEVSRNAALVSISDDGQVDGVVTHYYQSGAWQSENVTWQLPAPGPEPSTMILCGFALIAAWHRKQKKRTN